MNSLYRAWTQAFPPKPHFTETHVPDLTGKVYVVTGANTGIGKEVAQILYGRNATVWIAARNKDKSLGAIEGIKQQHPASKGTLKFVRLDLADLTTISESAREILESETRLDVLFNNAGVMDPPQGSKTKQGYELQLGTNCLGHHLFTKLLTPLLKSTAKTAPKDSVRVVWVSSSALDALSPRGGVELDNLDYQKSRSSYTKYGVSKTGNFYQNAVFARQVKQDGIVSVALNPGNLHSELDRTAAWYIYYTRLYLIAYPTIYGAYTELFSAFSPEVNSGNSGIFVNPWGRFLGVRGDVESGALPESEGGTGIADKFCVWCDEQVAPYV